MNVEDRPFAKLLNAGRELIAEGTCHLDHASSTITLETSREPGDLLKERGTLSVQLESGASYAVSDRPLVFRIWPPDRAGEDRQHRTLYRFRMVGEHQDQDSSGAALPGRTASS
jgi:hypothetical protein